MVLKSFGNTTNNLFGGRMSLLEEPLEDISPERDFEGFQYLNEPGSRDIFGSISDLKIYFEAYTTERHSEHLEVTVCPPSARSVGAA